MTFEDIKNEMVKVEGRVSALTKAKIQSILALVEKYSWLGKNFQFSATDIEGRVDEILEELTKTAYQLAEEGMDMGIEASGQTDDRDAIIIYAKMRNADMDKFALRLKHLLEGWIAIGFANKLSRGKLLSDIITYMDNPYISPEWRAAIKDGDFKADIIRAGGYRYGKGSPLSPVKGISLITEGLINTAYQYGIIQKYRRSNAIAYKVHRGSTFDCPTCDELCVGIHLLSEIVLPAHPRCRCYTTPVYSLDEL